MIYVPVSNKVHTALKKIGMSIISMLTTGKLKPSFNEVPRGKTNGKKLRPIFKYMTINSPKEKFFVVIIIQVNPKGRM